MFAHGQSNRLANPVFITEQGVWLTARMVADGDHYQVFINDEQVCDFQSSTLDKGGVALYSRNAEVYFDNLRITGNTIPDNVTAVDPNAKLTTTWGQIKGNSIP